jgi:uncharacterized UPF0160 family protein
VENKNQNKMDIKEKKIRIITHNGTFHVDDLFAVAVLQLIHGEENTEVIRSRDEAVWATGDYVVDVGNFYDPETKRYDHHQHGGAGARANGVPYSAFGLVWKHHGKTLCVSQEAWNHIDETVVTSIDLADNGIEVYTPTRDDAHPFLIHRVLVKMRPTWKEEPVFDERFMELLPFARRVIEREIISARDEEEGREFVRMAYESSVDKRIVLLDRAYPWQSFLSQTTDALYVVKPKSVGTNWEVECVRGNVHSFTNRKSLPLEWRGYRDEDLAQKTGVEDAVFCHNAGFIAVTKTKEGALRLAEIALNS